MFSLKVRTQLSSFFLSFSLESDCPDGEHSIVFTRVSKTGKRESTRLTWAPWEEGIWDAESTLGGWEGVVWRGGAQWEEDAEVTRFRTRQRVFFFFVGVVSLFSLSLVVGSNIRVKRGSARTMGTFRKVALGTGGNGSQDSQTKLFVVSCFS